MLEHLLVLISQLLESVLLNRFLGLKHWGLQYYLEGFFASYSRELGRTMAKYFDEIEYDLDIKNPASWVLYL